MWQKAHPIWLRVWFMKSWLSERHVIKKSDNASFFVEDILVRKCIENFYPRSWIAKVIIRKTSKDGEIIIFTSKTWILMGKDWAKLKDCETLLKKKFSKDFKITLKTTKIPELSSKIMAEHIATQLESRMPFRKVAKQVMAQVMEKWAEWVKIKVWWRLWWVDIARRELFSKGRVPLQTIRADIDYTYTTANTKYWILWIKVWIAKWEIFEKKNTITAIKEFNEKFD